MSSTQLILDQNIEAILEFARLAPSVHNSQPWKVQVNNNTLIVHIDKSHSLADGDPTGRQTVISIGIFCEAITIAARNFGLTVASILQEKNLFVLSFNQTTPVNHKSENNQLEYLRRRCSDRSLYSHVEISKNTIEKIEKSSFDLDVNIKVITDISIRNQIATFTSKGIDLAMNSPAFRQELSHHLILPWSHNKRGIAVRSLYINSLLALLQPYLLRFDLTHQAEVNLEKRRWVSASAIVIFLADGDLSKYWLQVGSAYLRASLAIEAIGLSQATSAAIVEASDYHEDIEALLQTKQRILAVIRIGKGSPQRYYSPRVRASELIT